MMENLAPYVSAILERPSPHPITAQETAKEQWPDQGFTVCRETTTYRFHNGVVIRRTVEQDDFPSELACAECWITYEVLVQGPDMPQIQPTKQVFQNACREAFWLQYHSA